MRRSTTLRGPGVAISLLARLSAALLFLAALPTFATAQDDGLGGIPITGIFQVGYLPSFQDSDQGGKSLGDGQGLEVNAGFMPGETFAFFVGYQLSMRSNYNTHFFPVSARVYSPKLLELGRVYGQAGIGLFFSQVSGKHGSAGNQRASAVRIGGGVEIDITDDFSGYVDGGWTNGLGSADSFKYGTVGVGLVYRWGGG